MSSSPEWARKAHVMGCPLLTASSMTEIRFHYGPAEDSGAFSWVREETHPYRRMIIGSAVNFWARQEEEKQRLRRSAWADEQRQQIRAARLRGESTSALVESTREQLQEWLVKKIYPFVDIAREASAYALQGGGI